MPTYTVVAEAAEGTIFATNEVPVDMHRKVMKSYSKLTPLTVLLQKISQNKARNVRIDHMQENAMPTVVTVTAAVAAGGTSMVVAAYGKSLVDDTLLFNPRTFDIARVNAAPTSNTVTIAKSAAGTTGVAWVAGDTLHVLPPQIEEDDEDKYRTASVKNDNVFNYVQLVRLQFAMSRMSNDMSTEFGGPGAKRSSLKAQKFREFREKWEKLIYFGGRSTGGTAPATTRSMGGLTHYLKDGTLYKDFGGVFTESGWDNLLLTHNEENPDASDVMALVSPNVRAKISYWGKGKIRMSPMAKKYGLWIEEYIGPQRVNLITLPLLTDAETRGWGWILDMSRIDIKNLSNPMFYPDAKNVGQSEMIYDTYRVATSMMIANENKHAMFVNAKL